MSTWAIVVAGGSGERFGERKQYLPLGGERVLDWALRSAAEAHRRCGASSCPADRAAEPEPLADRGGRRRAPPARRRCGPAWPPCPTTPT